MKVLVTGHKGFIGTVMVPMLQSAGHEVVGLDSDLYRYCTYGEPPVEVEEIIKDVRDVEISDLDGIDAIVHLAALSNDLLGNLNPELTMAINYRASVSLAKMAKEIGVKRFLFASSCSMYGAAGDAVLDESADFNPVTAYAKSKVLVEKEVSQLADESFSPTFLRNATAYGVSPRIRFDVVLNNLIAWAYTTGSILMKSDGTPWRPLVHIEDISRAFIAVLASPRQVVSNQAFNVGRNEENYQIRELADMVEQTVPNCGVKYSADAGPDERCYRVNFDKYQKTFPDHNLLWTARKGVQQIYNSYANFGLNEKDYEGPRYKRILHIRYLLSEGKLDDSLRWTTTNNN